MKTIRSAASAALALTAALALAACTPPNENDSDQPFEDNQTGVSSPSLPEGSPASESESATESSDGATVTESESEMTTQGQTADEQGAANHGTMGNQQAPAEGAAGTGAATDTTAQ